MEAIRITWFWVAKTLFSTSAYPKPEKKLYEKEMNHQKTKKKKINKCIFLSKWNSVAKLLFWGTNNQVLLPLWRMKWVLYLEDFYTLVMFFVLSTSYVKSCTKMHKLYFWQYMYLHKQITILKTLLI